MASEIVLVNVSGHDRPGLMAMLTSSLAPYQARVLDVGQAVIHDELSLGMLIEIPAGESTAAVLKDLLFLTHELGATVRFTPITTEDYNDWVGQQGRPRYIVTLLATGVTAEQLSAVMEATARHGLNADGMRRLSGRVPARIGAAGERVATRASIEISLRGTLAEPRALQSALLEAAGALDFDFSVQEDTVYRRNRRLVAFDMDSTLIAAEVIDELANAHGVGDRVAAITAAAMAGEIDFKESLKRRVALLEGLPEAELDAVAARVPLTEGAGRLVKALQRFGYTTAIISGGFTYVGERLKRELGIDYVFANTLGIDQGRVTGSVEGEIVDAERKAELLREICAKEGIELEQAIAIGDGANDLPMLSIAGLGVAFHAKPVVRASAGHSISNFGLDAVLYLMGFSDADIEQASR